MNWIKLLYPRPSFEVTLGPKWMREIHGKALLIAYYLTHTLALVCLCIIYFVVIVPFSLWALIKGDDLLDEKLKPKDKSYFQKSEDLALLDFKRMY